MTDLSQAHTAAELGMSRAAKGRSMNEDRSMNEEYLGDGLYASFDGWQITLRAPRMDGDHFVALEPSVYDALLRYVDRLKKPKEPA